jgi:hypothetical protein
MKNLLLVAMGGALVGIVAASFVVPPLLGWYASPGGLPQGAQVQAVVQIPEVIRYATSRMIIGQSIGAALGAALGLTMWFMWRRVPPRDEPRPDAVEPPAR